ncbi:MAG: peptidase dimerization domain-containing protein, partial [Ruthenibacterium lactatiformans]
VCLLAAPAEEYVEIGWRAGLRRAGEVQYLGGKQQLIAEGAFDDIDMAMMVHSETDAPQPRAVVAGAAGGFIGKELRFLGKEAHAGGAPWEGVNALNAASLAIAAIHANRETFRDEDHVRVHPIITKGGDLVNTVPADVRMEATCVPPACRPCRQRQSEPCGLGRLRRRRAGGDRRYAGLSAAGAERGAFRTVRGQRPGLRAWLPWNAVCPSAARIWATCPTCCLLSADGERLFRRGAQQGLAVADEALAYLAPAVDGTTVIDLLAGGAARPQRTGDAPRRTRDNIPRCGHPGAARRG